MGAQVLTELSGFAPPTIMAQAARLQARQRLFNLVITNVPGPQIPLYMLGRQLDALYPMVPLAENTALGIAIMSYNGQLNFGLAADYDALPTSTCSRALHSAIEEIVSAAAAQETAAPGPRPRPPHGLSRRPRESSEVRSALERVLSSPRVAPALGRL